MALRDLPGCGGHLRKLGGQGAAGHLPALVGSLRAPSSPKARMGWQAPKVMGPCVRRKMAEPRAKPPLHGAPNGARTGSTRERPASICRTGVTVADGDWPRHTRE